MSEEIYLIKQHDNVAIGSSKTLICPAYNQAEAKSWYHPTRSEFYPSVSKPLGYAGGWAFVRDYSPFVGGRTPKLPMLNFYPIEDIEKATGEDISLYDPFEGPGHLAYLTAYNTKGIGESFFSFGEWNFPAYYLDGEHIFFDVKCVEVYSYVRGAAKIFMKVWDYPEIYDYDVYYGTETNNGSVFHWIHETYPVNPRTCTPWTIYEVVLDMVPGLWLKSGESTAYAYHKPGAACKEYYVKITATDPNGIYPDEVCFQYPDFEWGNNAVGTNDPCIASCLYGGPEEWDDFYEYPMAVDHTITEPGIVYDVAIRDAPPGSDAINSLTVETTLADGYDDVESKLYVKVGGNYYYGDAIYQTPYGDTTASFTWSVNPATGLAWTRAEMLAARVGLECTIDTYEEYWYTIYDFHAEISYGSPSATFLPAFTSAGWQLSDIWLGNGGIHCTPCRPTLEAYICQAGPHEWGNSNDTTLNAQNARYFGYTATDLPPAGSTIDYVKIYFTLGAAGDYTYPVTYMPFVEFPQKAYYYGSSGAVGNGINSERNYTWSVNPATGLAWALADLQNLKYGVWLQHTDTDVDDPYADPAPRSSQIYGLKLEIGYNTVETITSDASEDVLWGDPVLHTSDLSELPPRGSMITTVQIDYEFSGSADETADCAMAAWIYLNGVYYFDTEKNVGDPFYSEIGAKAWATNPATGLPWTYEDITHLKFGAVLYNRNASGNRSMAAGRILSLNLIIYYDDGISAEPTYEKLAIGEVHRYYQNENPITDPEELVFSTNIELPERQEVAMFCDGEQKFHGIVISRQKAGVDRYLITAKSQSVMLQYRYIPMYSYAPVPDAFEQVLTIRDQFSADTPTLPFSQNSSRQHFSDTLAFNWPGIPMTDCRQSRAGILWLINSLVPPGCGTVYNSCVGKWAGFAAKAEGRCIFTTNHCPSPQPDGVWWWGLVISPGPDRFTWFAGEWQTESDYIGGVHRLALGANKDLLKPGEAYIDGEDIYIYTGGYPDSLLLCIDGYFDTRLRPGTWELADYYLNVANSFQGRADESINKFFECLGQEVRFRNGADGCVYIDAATEISRGSATNPTLKYIDGVNCTIKVNEDNNGFAPDAHLGVSGIGRMHAESDWKRPRSLWTNEIKVDGSRSDEDLAAYMEMLHTYDRTKYEISHIGKDYSIRVGDWILVKPKNYPEKAVRIRTIKIEGGKTKIVAGLSPNLASGTWASWRNAKGTVDLTKKYQSAEFTQTGAGPSTNTFVVKKEQCTDWLCRLSVSVQAEDGQIANNLVLKAVLNNLVLGRWEISDMSSSIDLDITAACSKSTAADTTNTIKVYLINGTSDYTTTYTIDQYKILKELSND